MKNILISLMLIIVAVTIYQSTIGGDEGTMELLKDRGAKINRSIESINP